MSDLRPLGSEKLPVDEKLKRIMEIANYGMNTKSTINEDNQLNLLSSLRNHLTVFTVS